MRDFLETLKAYEPLEFVVEVSHGNFGGFEAMAAFNVGNVAAKYASDCGKNNPHNFYRVRRREGSRWLTYEGTS